MSIEVSLHQVSPNILKKLKQKSYILEIFREANKISDLHNWEEIQTNFDFPASEKIKSDIPQILDAGKTKDLCLRKYWSVIHFYLTATDREFELPYLVLENSEILLVNAVIGGIKMDYDSRVKYLEHDQVERVAEALARISEESFEKRIKKLSQKSYLTLLQQEDKDYFLPCFEEYVKYYKNAASQEDSMLISVD